MASVGALFCRERGRARWTDALQHALALILVVIGACRSERSQLDPTMVDVEVLTTHPDEYAAAWVCTEGVLVSGFEASALGRSIYEEDGATHVTEPVIWIEQAEIRSRRDCFTAEAPPYPAHEFCRVEVCGRFDYGEKYGHAGCCDFQLSRWQ